MERKKRQNAVLAARSEDVQQSTKRGISRRQFVQTSAGVVAAGALLGKRAFAAPRPLKIGYVNPETGVLAPFGVADAFVVNEMRKMYQGGIPAGGATRPFEILVRDCQSSSNRAAEVAAQLIKTDKVDLMLVAGSPDVVNPVSDQCEVNQVPCVSTDAPWDPYFFGRGGRPDKGFDWTYHFYFGVKNVAETIIDIFTLLPTNKVVGALWADDVEGNGNADPVHGFKPILAARGFTCIDPGRFQTTTNDFSAIIAAYKNANCELIQGVLSLPVFSNFWAQAAQQGFRPKICSIGKALLFPAAVESLGPRGRNLAIELCWSPAFPFKSSLTGQNPKQLCDQFEAATHKEWMTMLGFRHSLFEVALDVFMRAKNPESNASVIEAVRTIRLDTIIGPVSWEGPLPNEWMERPVKNVCTTPMVGGQWQKGKKFMYDLVVVENRRYPVIPVQAKLEPLPA